MTGITNLAIANGQTQKEQCANRRKPNRSEKVGDPVMLNVNNTGPMVSNLTSECEFTGFPEVIC